MLFADSQLMGTLKGFNDKGLEFAAEIIAPYEASMLERPQLGQFLLIELGPKKKQLWVVSRGLFHRVFWQLLKARIT